MTTSKKWNKRGSRILAASLSIALVAANLALAGPVAHAAVAENEGSEQIFTSEEYRSFTKDGSNAVNLTFPELSITADAGEEMTGATVVINGYKPGDKITFVTENTGITLKPSTGNGVYILEGKASTQEYQNVLKNAKFTMTSPGERSLTFGLGPVPAFNKNGHFYEYVTHANIQWPDAKTDAEQKTYYGRKGYLVTITDADENAFIAEKAQGIGWIGGKDVAREENKQLNDRAITRVSTLQNIEKYKDYGDWRWVTGPEGRLQYEGKSGLPFYKGYKAAGGKNDSAKVTDATYGEMYTNWDGGEPNDSTFEHVVHIFESGTWNDYRTDSLVNAYLVEYGGMPGDSNTSINTTITLVDKTALKTDAGEAQGILDLAPQVYTKESLAVLKKAVDDAEAVLKDEHSSPEEVEAARKSVADAVEGLVKQPPVAEEASYTAGRNDQVSIKFDKPVKFNGNDADPTDDFRVTLDGKLVDVTKAVVSSEDPSVIILTLASPLVNDPVVRIEYDDEQSAIEAQTPGKEPVSDFTLIANGPFGDSLQIQEPAKGTEVYGADFPLPVSGQAALDSVVTAAVYNVDAHPDAYLFDLEVGITVTDNVYKWDTKLPGPLAPGSYHVAVTSTKTFGDEVRTETKLVPFTVPQLELTHVAVNEGQPDHAVLTFNQPVGSMLTEADLTGLTVDGRKVIAVKSVQGDKVEVVLEDALGPNDPLVVGYDPAAGNVTAEGNVLNELKPIQAGDQSGITKDNNVIPLQLIAAYPEAGKLKLVFNKPINDLTDLAGFTYGGVPLQEPFEINGNELIVPIPADHKGGLLSYDPALGNVTENGNKNNPLTGLQPGIDLGGDSKYISDAGKLPEDGLGLSVGGKPVPLSPAFQSDVPSGYQATVPNETGTIALNLAKSGGDGTLRKVSLNGVEVPDGDWSKLPLQEGLNIIQVDIVDAKRPGVKLGQYQIQVIRASGKLVSLDPSSGTLQPEFKPETASYDVSVANSVYEMSFKPVTLDPGAVVTLSIAGEAPVEVTNGDWSKALPLKVGKNEVLVTVKDSAGKTNTYTIIVTRQEPVSSGGGGSAPAPAPDTTKIEVIEVDVAIGGANVAGITKVPVQRTTHSNGTITDLVRFTKDKAEEAVKKAKETGQSIARVVIPDPADNVSEVNVQIPAETAKLLKENGIVLEIYTENAIIRIPNASLEGIGQDFYFRLVPVRNAAERNEIEKRATLEAVVREVAKDNRIEVVARPMTIETNLSSRAVTLILPLKDVKLPANEAERKAFLAQLGIFIEHTDGTKEVVKGKAVTYKEGLLGLEFSITKFSTFTIINFNNQAAAHKSYIVGFPDGQFKPDERVTRAQMALMIARNLNYDEKAVVSRLPFPDVALRHYAAGAIAFVNAQAVMKGDPNGQFRAAAPITRAEMAAVAANYMKLAVSSDGKSSFNDTKGHWAQAVIEANVTAGLLKGYPDGNFKPNVYLTRAEAVVIVNQMFDRGPLHGAEAIKFPDVSENHWAYLDIQEAVVDHQYRIDGEQKEQLISE
ncbi:S-layer homology domain-containing protein [Paenibacillus tritici]|uniref:S-layer homology domain-containing protein n=1 Tax=Paenibacillus tritici TaxID=1873425 RepID=A0ABX2DSA2_9BACL|nr:S-layer homology domain-containing protein [Paenibacillus tritici]NQX46908.1 S-layer homology domain-containing protein [Paenibacillus tritici]